MNQQNKPSVDIKVSCDICQKEIPKSLALVAEAEEYVRYYCGPECFEKKEKYTNKPLEQFVSE